MNALQTTAVNSGDETPIRLAVLHSHPIQYFAPLYAYLNADPRFDVTVLYMSDVSLRGGPDRGFGQSIAWDIDLLKGYRSVFLGAGARRRTPGGFFSLVAPQVWTAVRRGGFDALLVHGHNFAGSLLAIAAAKSAGIPVFVRGDSQLGVKRAHWKEWLRPPIMRAFYGLIDGALAVGAANAAYYRAMGVREDRIHLVPYTVDNERFAAQSRLSGVERDEWRARFRIPTDRPAVLFAAKFTSRKHPDDLLAAARRVRELVEAPFTVVMCGSGELESQLRAYCAEHAMENVVFTGFVNQSELPKLYGACDVFVLPSENEPWGLAVNEAMCAGLPVVASAEVGCVPDLVTDGLNGFTPGAGDVEGLAQALARLVADPELRARQGAASAERIGRWSFRESRDGLLAACASTLRRGRPAKHLKPAASGA